ncbi:MAG: hypothetical protein ABIP42_14195, partial [Planctomycetota bacterium]
MPCPKTLLRTLCALGLVFATIPSLAGAQDGPAAVRAAAVQASAPETEVRVLVERSDRASFNSHSAAMALSALAEGLDPALRPTALFALGASGERTMGPRLESWAVEGSVADRRAAILGLADGGFAPVELLTRLSRASAGDVREAALLGLARTAGERARTSLAKMCESDAPDHETAELARAFAMNPRTVPDWATGRAWLELRWEAARRYGLIDGKPWRAQLLSELSLDSDFLDALVYGAAAELHRVGTADHFLEVALSPGPPTRLRPVVNAIPSELDRMIQAGVWYPADQEEWSQVLFEIDERRLESLTIELLRKARVFPDLSAHASVLLVRAGNFDGLSMLELDIASTDPRKRERIAETLGGTHEAHYIDLLESLRVDEDARVRMAAMIAQMRLGNSLSMETVRGTLSGEASSERAALVEGISRLAYLPEMRALLVEYFDGFSPDERLAVAIAMAREGELGQSAALRAAMSESVLRSPRGEHYVQALLRIAANTEIQRLFDMFPLEESSAVNAQIALAMCARREPAVLPILRTALWQAPFDRSVLAAAVMQHVAGIDSVRIELD